MIFFHFQINLLVNFSFYVPGCCRSFESHTEWKRNESRVEWVSEVKLQLKGWKWKFSGFFFVGWYTWGSYFNFYQKLWCRDMCKLAILFDDSMCGMNLWWRRVFRWFSVEFSMKFPLGISKIWMKHKNWSNFSLETYQKITQKSPKFNRFTPP